jgi:hypothetical protein
MTVFDPDRWRTKTWERLRKDATKSASEIAHARWTADFLAVSSIEKIVAWCNTRCIEVKFTTTESHYDSSTKVISIAASARPLLHECGHHLIGSKEHDDRFKMGYPSHDVPGIKKLFIHRLSCTEEELEAWHRGWRLSRRLKLTLSREDYDAVRLACIKTYLKWSLRKGD